MPPPPTLPPPPAAEAAAAKRRRHPLVPRLDLSVVVRSIDMEPGSDDARVPEGPVEELELTSSGGSSSSSTSDGRGPELDLPDLPPLQQDGLDSGSKEAEDDLENGAWPDWTYSRYVVERQRRTLLDAVRCGPLRDGQRKLILGTLVALQVLLLLFALNAGGITASTTGDKDEGRVYFAIFAAIVGVCTLCFCYSRLTFSAAAMEARQVSIEGRAGDDLEEARQLAPGMGAAGDVTPPRGRDYKELLRLMKEAREAERNEAATEEGPPAAELRGLPLPAGSSNGAAKRSGSGSSTGDSRSWSGPDRRRYLQLRGGDEEQAAAPDAPGLRPLAGRSGLLRMMPGRHGRGPAARGRSPRVAAQQHAEGWS